jgi:hypothetical protein
MSLIFIFERYQNVLKPKTSKLVTLVSLSRITLTSFLLSIALSSCTLLYRDITEVPKNHTITPEWNDPESEIIFGAEIPLDAINDTLKKYRGRVYQFKDGPWPNLIPIGIKIKNVAYNPNKWMYVSNPLYSPNKWIEVCCLGGCIKTKNPRYDPRREIKTKNPAYSPNKYSSVNTHLATIEGYDIHIKVEQGLKFQPFLEIKNGKPIKVKVNISIPLDIGGNVTFLAPGIPIYKKKIEGKITIEFDSEITLNNDWTINFDVSGSRVWRQRLRLRLVDQFSLLDIDVTDLADPLVEDLIKDIEQSIKEGVSQTTLKDQVEKSWKNNILKINNDLHIVASPKSISLSKINVNNSSMKIYGGIKADFDLTNDLSNYSPPTIGPLPNLKRTVPKPPSIKLNVPAKISYSSINQKLLDMTETIEINEEAIKGKIIVSDIEAYPSGMDIVLKVPFKIDLDNRILDITGTAYFKGQLRHERTAPQIGLFGSTPKKDFLTYELNELSFNKYGNHDKHKLVFELAYKALMDKYSGDMQIDVTNEVNQLEAIFYKAIKELIDNYPPEPGESLIIGLNPEVRLQDWSYSKEDLIFEIYGAAVSNSQIEIIKVDKP